MNDHKNTKASAKISLDGETMETVTEFIFLGSKIPADGDCSHEIKRCLLLRSKTMTNLDSVLKSRDISLSTKICLVKAMVFPVVMYGCESWTIKKAECWIDAFELWCWRGLFRVTWTTRRSNQSILKEIIPEYSLEGLMLKLKLQYFGHLIKRTDSLGKTLMLGKIQGRRRRGWQDEMVGWHHQLDGHEFEQAPGIGDRQGSLACCSPWGCKESDMTEQLNWTELMGPDPWSSSFECWVLSPLSLSSRGSLVPLHFLTGEWYHLIIWDCWYFYWKTWFQLGLHPAQYFAWCTQHIS